MSSNLARKRPYLPH